MDLTIDETLELVQESATRFRSARLEHPLNWETLFGGFIVGQSLWAATQTVDDAFDAHSLQGFYVAPTLGDKEPIIYDVEKLRDGKSFVLRSVRATQGDRLVWTALCSFQRIGDGEDEQRCQPEMPQVELQPEDADALSPAEKLDKLLARTDLSDLWRLGATAHRAMHMRSPHDAINARRNDDDLRCGVPDGDTLQWQRLRNLSNPRQRLSALAYISDHDMGFNVAKAVVR